MGIKYLNRFLRENCPESIGHIKLDELSGKKIAIDISIYLYKYEADNVLLENIYLMLATFRHHDIIPVFIFDGKPPAAKKELLQKRRDDKLTAQNEYDELKDKLENINANNSEEAQEIVLAMNLLKKQFVSISRDKINKVKDLIRAYGATYYDAPGEADALCAMLVITKRVWACLSEDMDLFVYGCNRVLRYLSLTNHSAIIYYTKGILRELNMTQKEFKDVCILSGTDYNMKINNLSNNIISIMQLFTEYKNDDSIHNNNNTIGFYTWIINNKPSYLELIFDWELLDKISKMFDFSNELFQTFKNIKIINGYIQKETIQNIMREDGFMFIN
jgi:flap endonuclease-1